MSNTKKTVYLMGGLGNVLFQINYAHNLKDRGFDVALNVYLLRENFITKKLLGWSIHDTHSSLMALDLISSFELEDKISIFFFFGLLSKYVRKRIFNCQFFGLISPDCKKLKVTHLFGYFHIKNPINSGFIAIAKRAIEKRLDHPDSKCVKENLRQIGSSWVIHIRGGDYKLDQNFSLNSDYYIKAINDENNFYVVTNDQEFSKKALSELNLKFNFVASNSALDDFIIITLSRKKIISNSTFSWWAAEIGSENSLIIQPDPFFKHLNWQPMTTKNRQNIKSQPISNRN